VILLILAAGGALACAKKPEAPAVEEKAALEKAPAEAAGEAVGLTASAFELKMRVLEGAREKAPALRRPVTSSYLNFMNFSNYELEEDVQAEQQIRKVYSLKDVSLLTEATLSWMKGGKADKAFHMFRLNGQEYAVFVTPGKLAERNRFRIEVFEQRAAGKESLLDTEFALPDKTAAVFGFETSEFKPYFITLRVTQWVGGPEAAGGGEVAGGVVGDVVKAGGSDRVKPPRLVTDVQPVYPEAARKARVEGVVITEATTDTYGRVVSVKVLRSIPLLDQAAVDAVRQWVYEPMVINGKPRPVVFTVTMRFRLDDEKKPQVSVSGGGAAGGVEGGVEGGVVGGVEGGVLGGVEAGKALKEFEGDAVRAIGDVKPPRLVRHVDPIYPAEARKAGVEGIVILEAKTDERGRVADTKVLRSIPVLDRAAVDAVKQWEYEPMIIDGKPHKVVFTVTVRFQLEAGKKPTALEKFAVGAVRAEGEIKPPKLVKEVQPVYPEIARQAGVQGVVILSVKTDKEGKVNDVIVLRSIPLLDQAAIDAVRQWVYEPLVIEGKARPAVFTVTVRFELK
jgi:TonB family protein